MKPIINIVRECGSCPLYSPFQYIGYSRAQEYCKHPNVKDTPQMRGPRKLPEDCPLKDSQLIFKTETES